MSKLYWDYYNEVEHAIEYDNSMDFNLDCSLENIAEIADNDSGGDISSEGSATIFVWNENKELIGEFIIDVEFNPSYYVYKKN